MKTFLELVIHKLRQLNDSENDQEGDKILDMVDTINNLTLPLLD